MKTAVVTLVCVALTVMTNRLIERPVRRALRTTAS
jgi:hypothetical protein